MLFLTSVGSEWGVWMDGWSVSSSESSPKELFGSSFSWACGMDMGQFNLEWVKGHLNVWKVKSWEYYYNKITWTSKKEKKTCNELLHYFRRIIYISYLYVWMFIPLYYLSLCDNLALSMNIITIWRPVMNYLRDFNVYLTVLFPALQIYYPFIGQYLKPWIKGIGMI